MTATKHFSSISIVLLGAAILTTSCGTPFNHGKQRIQNEMPNPLQNQAQDLTRNPANITNNTSNNITKNQANQTNPTNQMNPPNTTGTVETASLVVGDQTTTEMSVQPEASDRVWIPLSKVADSLAISHRTSEDASVFQYGDTDPLFTLKVGSPQAQVEGKSTQLKDPPKMVGNEIYVSNEALSQILGTPVRWNPAIKQLIIQQIDDDSIPDGPLLSSSGQETEQNQGASIESIPNVNNATLVKTAKHYRGVPYKFAAGPYKRTHRFDCSTFTQYVFRQQGIHLPASSRAQSRLGVRVGINSLKPGDLLFFYTPGRYRSNRIVGHVAMYIGNNRMIHTYGKPGVTVGKFSPYWRSRFLFAKRIAR